MEEEGGSSNGTSPTPAGIVVSGTVTAPGGAVAFMPRPGLFHMFAESLFPVAYASLAGMATVPDGTPVDLVRIDDTGTVVTVVASTTTLSGKYSFDLTKLGIGFSSDLVVQVTGTSSGARMRAFVGTGGTVDLDPVSETAVRIVMEQIAASPGISLGNFTTRELSDIAAAVNLLAMTQSLTSGFDIETTVTVIENAVAANTNIMGFIVAASATGQSSQGPGDIGDYFPFASGMTWQYRGTLQNGGQTTNYTNTVQITGTQVVNGITTTVFHETNPNPANGDPPSDDYLVKDDRGITNYGNSDTTDFLTPQVAPYREYAFPLGLAGSYPLISKPGVTWAQDIDGDGKTETANITASQMVASFETVAVVAGTYPNAAKIVTTVVVTVTLSSNGSNITDASTISEWYAPGVGLVKSVDVEKITVQGVTDTTTTTEELTARIQQLSLATNDLVYDGVTKKIYASVPSSAGNLGNSIVSIDPMTGAVGPAVFVGNEPNKLAISDNGQYLYVGLDGDAAVRRYDLATQTAGLQFALGSDPTFGSFTVGDMEVLPGSPSSVAIVRKIGWWPSSDGVAIYDDGVVRANITPNYPEINVIEFSASSSRLYGYDNETSGFGVYRMSIDATGVSIADATSNLISGYNVDIKFDNGLIYATNGTVVDPEARTVVGAFPVTYQYGCLVRPDSAAGRVYFLVPNLTALGSVTVQAFDQKTFSLLGSLDLKDVAIGVPPGMYYPSSFIRWGTKGLAFRTSENKVVILITPLIP